MKKKRIITACYAAAAILVGVFVWWACFSTTKVAFVNFQTINLGNISKTNGSSFIELREVSTDHLDELTNYDMVFVNGVGLHIVEEQRQLIRRTADKGVSAYTSMATSPANSTHNLDSVQMKQIRQYLIHTGKVNYRNLLSYVRKEIDGKLISAPAPEAPVEKPTDLLYHVGVKNPDDETEFLNVSDYEKFLRENELYKEGARKIMITGQMADATELIKALEEAGHNVYPVSSFTRFVGFVCEIRPDAVINMAYGRMGDVMVEYLKERNIPLFAPFTISSLVEDWENDPMGISGGFLSQSVVTPEIDGAIRPFILFAQYKDDEGLQHLFAVPEWLETLVNTVNNYLSLKTKPSSEKYIVTACYKGPGQNALTASGMEVGPSLYNLLLRVKKGGYWVENLPANAKDLEKVIQAQKAVFGMYAEGVFDEFTKTGNPELVTKEQYESWVKVSLRPEKYAEVVAVNGEFPGQHITTSGGRLGIARLQFGNVVLMPQVAAGSGDNAFQAVHGTNAAPSHTYTASYLWIQHGFKADAMIHFGTHGSLEFAPRKQVTLCSNDWPDRLVGTLPHLYIYSIGDMGEGMIAKRRSYITLQSYLTSPLLESSVRGIYRDLVEKTKIYNNATGSEEEQSLAVKTSIAKLGIHRELGLDSLLTRPYSEDGVARVGDFAEELAMEKITGRLYTMGIPYEPERITSSVLAMATESTAYSLLSLDKQCGKATADVEKHRSLFTQRYPDPARALVEKLIGNPALAADELVCRTAGVSPEEPAKTCEIEASRNAPKGTMAIMMAAAAKNKAEDKTGKATHKMPEAMKEKMKETGAHMDSPRAMEVAKKMGASPEALKKMEAKMNPQKVGKKPAQKEYSKKEINFALALTEVERTIRNVSNHKAKLANSPEKELASLVNALNGGYAAPSPGGDPIANPNALPARRNMYAINAEATPSESAWEKGVALAKRTIETYRSRHNDSIPRKVSYTLWFAEFIETGGATIAQVLYMLGVEPVRDAFERASDLKLIPSAELGRPRIDVVAQTSEQFRDIAVSRLFLINRVVEMAAAARGDKCENQVAASVVEAERALTEKGISPKDAHEMAAFRVFGGVNGMCGTGIQEMVESGGRWENESEIAATYLNNMGAYYGSEKNWEAFRKYVFEVALTRADVVVQPYQSNTWGALSLDYVYEFMGGMNLAVRNVTGKDSDAYLSDYRNRNHMRMREVKEAVGVESRTTILNPAYIKERMKGGSSSAAEFAETVTNTYGWNATKPAAIDKELWGNIYNVYVKDEYNLNVKEFFETQSPAALEGMTVVMLENVRKGLWKASAGQTAELAKLHIETVNKYRPSCSGFVCDNAKPREYIASRSDAPVAVQYKGNITKIHEAKASGDAKGVVMKKEEINQIPEEQKTTLSNITVGAVVVVAILALVLFVRKCRKTSE